MDIEQGGTEIYHRSATITRNEELCADEIKWCASTLAAVHFCFPQLDYDQFNGAVVPYYLF